MRPLLLAAAITLAAAAPAQVPMGNFRAWLSSSKAAVSFSSGGVAVHIAPLPCPDHPDSESSCSWAGYNNQATVTVEVPGVEPVTVTTDRQAEFARVAVVRFSRADPRPGVIVESQYGGSGGLLTVQLVVPAGRGYRVVPLVHPRGGVLEGEIANRPRDLSGDGAIDLVLYDGAFDSVWGCNACTPRPKLIYAVKNGTLIDETTDPALRGVFLADMARLGTVCASDQAERNGACAAYVASAARAGRFDAAWALVLKHYVRGTPLLEGCDTPPSADSAGTCPAGGVRRFSDFPTALRAFLQQAGYLP